MLKNIKTYQFITQLIFYNLLVVDLFARIGRTYEDWPVAIANDALSQTELPTRLTSNYTINSWIVYRFFRITGLRN